jgi:hypothetical protein
MNAKFLTGMSLALVLGACVSMPRPNAALESARMAVHTAEADPTSISMPRWIWTWRGRI